MTTITKHVPFRWLRLTSPFMDGPDVTALQVGLNKRLVARGRAPIPVDGEYGPTTRDAVRTVLWFLGCPSDGLDLGALTKSQRIIRDPDNRPGDWYTIAADRKRWLADQRDGADDFLKQCRAYLGKTEQPMNSNRGDWLDPLHRAAGFAPETRAPYCAIALIALYRRVDMDAVANGWAYTPSWVNAIRAGDMGWKAVSKEDRKPGDAFFIKIPGVSRAVCDHVGTIEDADSTIEFNTSSGQSGSQNNGGGVYRRDWAGRSGMVVCVGRPPWN